MFERLWREERLRFLAIGVANTAFGYAVFAWIEVLLGDRWPYLAVLLGSYGVSVVFSFFTQRLLVFRVSGYLFTDAMRFLGVSSSGLLLNAALLPLLVELLFLPVLLAQALALTIGACVLYLAHSRISFRRATGASSPRQEPPR
ncbi:MAG: GtrA family protein [Mycobacteriales bacterium]|nr:GtrA family protein [Mycobacteriales bacterium]